MATPTYEELVGSKPTIPTYEELTGSGVPSYDDLVGTKDVAARPAGESIGGPEQDAFLAGGAPPQEDLSRFLTSSTGASEARFQKTPMELAEAQQEKAQQEFRARQPKGSTLENAMAPTLEIIPHADPAEAADSLLTRGQKITHNVVADTVNFFTSPVGIGTLGLGAAPKAIQKVVAAVFATQAAHAAPELVREVITAKTPEERDRAIAGLIETGAVGGLTGKHFLEAGPRPAARGFFDMPDAEFVARATSRAYRESLDQPSRDLFADEAARRNDLRSKSSTAPEESATAPAPLSTEPTLPTKSPGGAPQAEGGRSALFQQALDEAANPTVSVEQSGKTLDAAVDDLLNPKPNVETPVPATTPKGETPQPGAPPASEPAPAKPASDVARSGVTPATAERAKDFEFEQYPKNDTPRVDPTPQERDAIIKAAREIQAETGFPANSIADVMERAGITDIDRGRGIAVALWRGGDAHLSAGDWSLSDARTRAWTAAARKERNTQIQIREDAKLSASVAETRTPVPETPTPEPVAKRVSPLDQLRQLEEDAKPPNPHEPEKVDAYATKLPEGPQSIVRDVLLKGTPVEEAAANAGISVKKAQETVDRANAYLEKAKTVKPLAPRDYVDEPTAEARPDAVDEVVRSEAGDWASATEDAPPAEGMKRGGRTAGTINLPSFPNRKMSELDRATTNRSAKLQKSFDEASRAQKEITKAIPSQRRQAAVSVWMEADGDATLLSSWEATAKGKAFREAARLAQTLTPEEIAIAKRAQAAFKVLAARGSHYDVLKNARDNYIPHMWDVEKKPSISGSGRLQQNFKFAKARSFDTLADGDAAGFVPKTLSIGKLLPAYLTEMNKVIADRQFVQDMVGKTAKDGRPLLTARGGVSATVSPTGDYAYLVNPEMQNAVKDATGNPIDTSDYKVMGSQPALHDWLWKKNDLDGNPIFMKSDLAVHPEAAKRITAMLGKSAIREWYSDPTHEGASAVLPVVAKALDRSQAVMKREMFGLLAPFHQVQEGWHGIAHWVNPFFDIPKIDLRDPAQMDAARHGLMLLPDKASGQSYVEGLGGRGTFLTQAARFLGEKADEKLIGKASTALADVVDGYQNYLFHQYIPGLKMKTYEAILGRNQKLYAKELTSTAMSQADVKLLSAEQTNAAYGHLNYALLDRNPTMQHLWQIALLAPDFLEARAKFTGQAIKGATGSKVGVEQFIAIARIAAVQAALAYTAATLAGGEWDEKHPFEAKIKGRRYTLRSVPEDIASLISDPRQFTYGRVNPLVVKGGIQAVTGLNYRGEKTTGLETMEELMAQYIPITARSIPAIRSLTETSRNNPISPLEQLAGSSGLRISRASPISETYKTAGKWMEDQKLPKDKGSYPVSKYQQLRYALEDGDLDRAGQELDKLKTGSTRGKVAQGFRQSIMHPFTQSSAMDTTFRKSLKPNERAVFDLAVQRRKEILQRFEKLR